MSSCPADVPGRGRSKSISASSLYFPVYNMETGPDQAGLLGFDDPADRLPGLPRPARAEPTATTGSTRSARRSSRCSISARIHGPLGRPRRPDPRPVTVHRCRSPASAPATANLRTEGCPPGMSFVSPTFAKSTIPPAPFLQNPTTCGEPLTATATSNTTPAFKATATAPWPATTGCDQLSFNPSLTVKPTTDRGGHRVRPGHRPQGPADASPTPRRPRRSARRP